MQDAEKGAVRVIQTQEQGEKKEEEEEEDKEEGEEEGEEEGVFEQSVSATNDSNSAGGGSGSLCAEDGKFNLQVAHISERREARRRTDEIKGKRRDSRTLEQ